MNLNNTKAQMRKGVLELCVLSIIEGEKSYPSDIIKKLKAAKLIVVEGTLYPLLARLRNGDILDYDWQESNAGPPRKYYHLTDTGKRFLAELRNSWSALQNSVESTMNHHAAALHNSQH